MRIALVSTPFVSVPPRGYGGTELVVAELARALIARGHEVVVYATGDSSLPEAELRWHFREAQWPPDSVADRVHGSWCLRDAARDPRGFDVVHLHSAGAMANAELCPYPIVYTIHHDANPELSAQYLGAPHVKLVAISHNQARGELAPVAAVIHHGLDPARFPAMPDHGYLLYIGRYARAKGCVEAVEIAVQAGLPLIMAGAPHEREYYERELKPLIDRHGVLEIGAVQGRRKTTLIARARALLFPIQWDEPFGLVMIEAMLSGVPVLATARGSAPEIVEDGITGILCDDPAEMVGAARASERLFDRARIRARARRRWSADRMAGEYLQVYEAAQQASLEGTAAEA
jgi:glycosyltransferase involved in cell wall biosynthesis